MIDKILSIFKLTQPKPIQRVEWVDGELVIPDWLKGDGEPIKQPEYVRPQHRCTKWILLAGNIYGDEHYSCAVLIETRNLIAWITRHAENTSVSILAQQQAKEYMPTWFAMADNEDETVTILDKHMKSVVHDYIAKFEAEGNARFYCPPCKTTYSSVKDIEHERSKDGNWRSWKNEYHCIKGHRLYYKESRMHFMPSRN